MLKRWEHFADEDQYRYHVTISNDGSDCDGPIDHGREEFEMSYFELAARIGMETIRHGAAHTVEIYEGTYNTHVQMVFSSNHDEGFSRTFISWEEIPA